MSASDRAQGPQDEEAEIAAFLASPLSYPEVPERVEMIETHAARVFLAGDKAFKIKKRVKLPFLDFSSLARRRSALVRELELNRPHAPEIYLGLLPIARSGGQLQFGPDGTVIDYALEMRRFEQAALLAEVAKLGPLSPALCRSLAEMAARYHRASPVDEAANGAGIMGDVLTGLVAEIAGADAVVDGGHAREFRDLARDEHRRCTPHLDQRGRERAVRRCHGDLHLGNIVLIGGAPVPFDALEFDERLATIDVLYDLAFLLMDLDVRAQRQAANRVLNAYIGESPVGHEIEGLATLPLFLAARAAVRAVVAIERTRQRHPDETTGDADTARRYLEAAIAYLAPAAPALVAVGGLSGTGKSTLAAALAPGIGRAPGALHLRSDVERKRLAGVPETQALSREHYTQAASDRIYEILLDKADRALAAGHSVIIDAVALEPAERAAMEKVARRAGCPFQGLWLEAPIDVMVGRVTQRTGDASDADADVVRFQSATGLGAITWTRIDAGRSPQATQAEAEAVLTGRNLLA